MRKKIYGLSILLFVFIMSSCAYLEPEPGYDEGFEDGYDSAYFELSNAIEEEFIRGFDSGYSEGHYEGYDEGYEDGHENGYIDGHYDCSTEAAYDYESGYQDGLYDGYYEGATYTCLYFGDVDKAFLSAMNGCAWYTFIEAYDQYVANIYDDDDRKSELHWAFISVMVSGEPTQEEVDLLVDTFGEELFSRNGINLED